MKNPAHRMLVAFTLCSISSAFPALAASPPSQFIAKIYTEALGRAPTEQEWESAHYTFRTGAINSTTLRNWAKPIYMGTEYDALYKPGGNYDHEARLITLYRGVLNREPDVTGRTYWMGQLTGNPPRSWSSVLDAFMSCPEFETLVLSILGKSGYGFGATEVPDPIAGGTQWQVVSGSCTYTPGSPTALQDCLNSFGPSGGEIALTQKAVIRVPSPLVIPAAVKLYTAGSLTRQQYALYGRIVRGPNFTTGPVVRLGKYSTNSQGAITQTESAAGAELHHVWVDGQRTRMPSSSWSKGVPNEQANVIVGAGLNTKVSDCVLTNPAGLLNLYVRGKVDFGTHPSSSVISNNLVTGYPTCHTISLNFCDGISVSSENANVYNNEIIDATDVGITVFKVDYELAGPPPYESQDSWIHDNRIIAAGNSAFAGICADPGPGNDTSTPFPFGNLAPNGSSPGKGVRSNRIYTGKRGHFDFGLLIGTRPIPWVECQSSSECQHLCKVYQPDGCTLVPSHIRGTGAGFVDNILGTSAAMTGKFRIGIAVSGMTQATVTGNTIHARDVAETVGFNCPSYDFVLDNSGNGHWGSFATPPGSSYQVYDLVNCLWHPQAPCPVDSPPFTQDWSTGCGTPPCQGDPAPTLVHDSGIVVDVDGTSVSFSMEHRADQINSVRVFDVSGRSLALVRREGVGTSSIRWDGRVVAPGVYHYLASTNRGTLSGRFILVK